MFSSKRFKDLTVLVREDLLHLCGDLEQIRVLKQQQSEESVQGKFTPEAAVEL